MDVYFMEYMAVDFMDYMAVYFRDYMAVQNCIYVCKILFIFATDLLTNDLCEIARNVYEKVRISTPKNTSVKGTQNKN